MTFTHKQCNSVLSGEQTQQECGLLCEGGQAAVVMSVSVLEQKGLFLQMFETHRCVM